MTSFIDEVMLMTSEAESPRQWIWWSALSAIAAVAGPNTILDHQYYKLSPNMFVMLLGDSGLGKGFPIWLAKELVESLDVTRTISGRNSIEAVVQQLGTITSRPGKPPIPDSRGFLISGEFRNFIIQSPNALTILTELYDTHYNKKWKNTLKTAGIDSLKNVCLTMLGASSPAHYKEAISDADVEGGYAARTLHIYETEMGNINPLTSPLKIPFNLEKLLPHLREIANIKGEFTYGVGATDYFDEWYIALRQRQQKERRVGIKDESGLEQRIHNHVDKVAMCLSLSRRTDLVLTRDDFEESIRVCQGLLVDIKRADMGVSKEEISKLMGSIIHALLNAPDYKLPKAKLLQRLWQRGLNTLNLALIHETMCDSLIARVYNENDDQVFQLTDDYVKLVEEHRKKKEKKE